LSFERPAANAGGISRWTGWTRAHLENSIAAKL
jgi:hypothetical protein